MDNWRNKQIIPVVNGLPKCISRSIHQRRFLFGCGLAILTLVLPGLAPGANTAGAGGDTIIPPSSAVISITVTDPSAAVSYASSFNLTESPISEGGKWHANGFGLIRSDIGQPALRASSTPVVTAGGMAHGTSAAASTSGFDDSWAILSGFPADQSVTATLAKPNASGSFTEVELLLRFDDSGNSARGYECYMSGYGQYLNVVRWNPDGTFTYLYEYGAFSAPSTGDVFEAQIVGTVITCKINNVTLFRYDVASAASSPVLFSTGNALSTGSGGAVVFTTGNPGMGFDTDGNDAGFGFSSYAAKGL